MTPAAQRIHFVGIGGAGMSAIAELLHAQGHLVSGSDASASETTRRLAAQGMQVFIGHHAAHIAGAQVVVASTAVAQDNPELLAAHAQHLPLLARAEMLAELMRFQRGIAVAGTHGKTTTSALVASVLMQAGADPSFVVGGTLLGLGGNARLGQGAHIVVEADESDASFLHLNPVLAVVTNIDADHMPTYGHDLARLHAAFVAFIHRLPWWGRAVLCGDDPGVHAILPQLRRPHITYGLEEGADVRALDVTALAGGGMRFTVQRRGAGALPVTLALSGLHNVRNALAAVAVAGELGLRDDAVQQALAGFAGVGRRFQRCGELRCADGGQATLIDDYGHHPTEVAAVIAAARGAFPGRRLVLAFQPHRYTRTRDCLGDFASALGRADVLLLTEVYAAGEAPIAGADGAALAQAVRAAAHAAGHLAVHFDAEPGALRARVKATLRARDVLITLGAGSIAALPGQLMQEIGAMP